MSIHPGGRGADNGKQGHGEQSREQRGGSQPRGTDWKHGKRVRAEASPEETTSNQPRATRDHACRGTPPRGLCFAGPC